MREIVVNVMSVDIDQGEQMACLRCPVALALQRATQDPYASVMEDRGGTMYATFNLWGLPGENKTRQVTLPELVSNRVMAYDESESMEPFEFTLLVEG